MARGDAVLSTALTKKQQLLDGLRQRHKSATDLSAALLAIDDVGKVIRDGGRPIDRIMATNLDAARAMLHKGIQDIHLGTVQDIRRLEDLRVEESKE